MQGTPAVLPSSESQARTDPMERQVRPTDDLLLLQLLPRRMVTTTTTLLARMLHPYPRVHRMDWMDSRRLHHDEQSPPWRAVP